MMKLVLSDENLDDLVEVALLDVVPAPDEPYFTTLDVVSHNHQSVEEWLEFFEGINVMWGEEILTPDDGEPYIQMLAREFRGPYLNSRLEDT